MDPCRHAIPMLVKAGLAVGGVRNALMPTNSIVNFIGGLTYTGLAAGGSLLAMRLIHISCKGRIHMTSARRADMKLAQFFIIMLLNLFCCCFMPL